MMESVAEPLRHDGVRLAGHPNQVGVCPVFGGHDLGQAVDECSHAVLSTLIN